MKIYQRFFILGSGLFTFFCFRLPWDGGRSGFWHCANDDFGIIIALIASIVTIGSILLWRSRILILISSIIGVIYVLSGHFSNLKHIEYGATLTAVGFFLTIAGVRFFPKSEDNFESIRKWFYPKTTDNTESIDNQDHEANAQGEEE